jgi:hypothetical protein
MYTDMILKHGEAKKIDESLVDGMCTWYDDITYRGSHVGVAPLPLVLPSYDPTADCLCIAVS